MDTRQDDCKALHPRPVPTGQARSSWWMVAVQFVLGGVGGFGVIAAIDALPGELTLPLLAGVLAVVLLMLWLQVLVHEAGHALAGLLAGRRFIAAGVGPLRLERGDGVWNLRWGGGIKGIGGFAATFPPGPERRRSAALFVLGGPVANLASAASAGAVLAVADVSHPLAMAALGSTALAGLLLGVVNLVPLQSHGWHSDGQNLRELLRDSPAWRVMQGQQLAVAAAMAGIRPRDWPVASAGVPEGLPPQLRAPALSLAVSVALDRGEIDAARQAARALAGIWPGLPDGQCQAVAVVVATYAARAGDAELLAAWRPHCEGGLLDLSPYRLWLDAEAAAMAGNGGEARRLVGEARAALPRVHDRSSVVVLGEYLDALEGRVAR